MTTRIGEQSSKGALAALCAAYRNLPAQYVTFLERTNGAEGPIGVEPRWCVIWSAEQALVATTEYELPKYLPGYFAFGGNGGGELFVFSLQVETNEDRPISMVPAVGMAEGELIRIAPNFAALVSSLSDEVAGARPL